VPSPSSSTPPSDYNNEEDDSSDEKLPLVPLIFRTNHVDSYGQLRSSYGKRSPIDIWSETDISAALDATIPAPVEEVIPATEVVPVEEVISSVTEIIVPDDQVESQTDHPDAAGAADITLADEEIDYDLLPFPLPLPLAFRPDAV
jgi:hypothetical protein